MIILIFFMRYCYSIKWKVKIADLNKANNSVLLNSLHRDKQRFLRISVSVLCRILNVEDSGGIQVKHTTNGLIYTMTNTQDSYKELSVNWSMTWTSKVRPHVGTRGNQQREKNT